MGRFLFLSLTACWCAAQTPTIDQSLNAKAPVEVALSPDGAKAAYTVRETDWSENEFVTQVWIADVATGASSQWSRGKKSASSLSWSPDGRWLTFLRDRDGKTQIWAFPSQGGEALVLTADESGVQSYNWSRDGKRIAYTSTGPEPKELKDRKEKYGDFQVVAGDYRHSHLFVLDIADPPSIKPAAVQVTSGSSFSVNSFEWSPDGESIAFSGPSVPDLSAGATSDIYIVRVSDKTVRKLVDLPGPDSGPTWSPDGQSIAFSSSRKGDEGHYYMNERTGIVPAAGGAVRWLPDSFDEEKSSLEWTPRGILFSALQRTTGQYFSLDPQSGSAKALFGSPSLSVGGVSFDKGHSTAAFFCTAPNGFTEICAGAPGAEPKVLTTFSRQYDSFRLASRELIRWKSQDGAEIEGVLLKPADFQPGRRYPLLVVIHGGPTGIDRPFRQPDRTYPIERLAAKSALVLRPNYRGSAGYGEAFRSLNVRNLGVGDMWDVMSGVDHLISLGLADPDKLGAMGWSQGGYISAFLATNTTRFKAISVGAGISDWMTYYVNTDIHPFTRQYLKATPWDDPAVYAKTSPITNIRNAKTPVLIQHGENDRRVPLPNAFELYQGLIDQNVPARLVVYKGFGHGINKPKQQRHVMEDNERWFARWIWGESAEPAAETGK